MAQLCNLSVLFRGKCFMLVLLCSLRDENILSRESLLCKTSCYSKAETGSVFGKEGVGKGKGYYSP